MRGLHSLHRRLNLRRNPSHASANKHITTIDPESVALAAIQGLYRQNKAPQRENRTLRARLGATDQGRASFSKLSQ